MLDVSNIIQIAEGNTGATTVTTLDINLASPAAEGNLLVIIIGWPGQTGSWSPSSGPGTWNAAAFGSGGGGTTIPFHQYLTRDALAGGETHIATITRTVADGICWLAMEMSDMCSGDQPFFQTMVWDTPVSQGTWFNPGTTTVNIPGGASPCASGDEIIFCTAASRMISGAMPAFSSIADIAGGQPGTWTALGTSQATSKVGENVQLDHFYRLSGGTQSTFDAAVTYASAPDRVGGLITGYRAFSIPPQRTSSRAATNSMT